MILTIIIFILILGLLVFVHELGHFLVAKRNGVRVDEFGFGFSPRIFGVEKGETTYSINAIPLGGFVKIYGEEGEGDGSNRSFVSKKLAQKLRILFAGVAMNFLLAVLLFSLGHFIGLPTAIEENQIEKYPSAQLQIIGIASGSPAEMAGIKTGDFVVALKSQSGEIIENLKSASQFQDFVDKEKDKEIIVSIKRGDEVSGIKLTPRVNPPQGQGPIGVELAAIAKVRLPWYQAIWQGFLTTVSLAWMLLSVLYQVIKNLFTTGKAGVDIVGPVGIFNLTGQAASMGFIYLLQLTAVLSINLAIINAFPFPALDGGRGLFLLIEKIKGSPISVKTVNLIHNIGFALLILLMVAITYRDVVRFF